MSSLTIVFAYALDLILGDPQGFPHPVRLMGKLISALERLFRKVGSSPIWLRCAGVLLAGVLCGAAYLLTALLIRWTTMISPMAGLACSALLAYTTLAVRDLHVETRKVLRALEAGDLPLARRELSYLVGRDTARLEEPEILRALVETVAENISDGVTAPLFYLALGGPAGAMTYKAVNTLDSMVGYKNEKFRHLGWAPARLDDVANYLPARLSGFLIVLSCRILGGPWRDSLRILRRDHARHPSPNSAWPEAAVAGALGIRLGGRNHYFGRPQEKPFLGDRKKPVGKGEVREAWKIMYLSSFFMLILALALNWIAGSILALPGKIGWR